MNLSHGLDTIHKGQPLDHDVATNPNVGSPSDSPIKDKHALPIQTQKVFLDRYVLSSSSLNQLFAEWFIKLIGNSAAPDWLSHFVLRIGDDHFQIRRDGKIPFTSTATLVPFRSGDETHQTLGTEIRLDEEKTLLGTTSLSTEDILTNIKNQDKILADASLGSTSCLMTRREYSLLNNNCQHSAIELARRLGIHFNEGVLHQLLRDSVQPRNYCGQLLAYIGLAITVTITTLIVIPTHAQLRSNAFILAAIYHFIFCLVGIQDFAASTERIWRIENEERYLGIKSCSGIPWVGIKSPLHQSSGPNETDVPGASGIDEQPKRDEMSELQHLWGDPSFIWWSVSCCIYPPPIFGACFRLPWSDIWTTSSLISTILLMYLLLVVFPAYITFRILKSTTGISDKIQQEKDERELAAYNILKKLNLPRGSHKVLSDKIGLSRCSGPYLRAKLMGKLGERENDVFSWLKEKTDKKSSEFLFGIRDLKQALSKLECERRKALQEDQWGGSILLALWYEARSILFFLL